MSMRPLVSVCIANYNGMEVIDACLESVLAQTGGLVFEIIVHDDASTDGSVSYLKDNFPNVRLIESNENVGFCIANNRMAEVAQGDYLLLLNNDAALFSDALKTLYEAADQLDKTAILGLPQYDANSGKLIDIGCLFDPFLNPVPNKNAQRQEVGMVIGACLWIPSALWKDLGGFPEWFGSIGEDLYLCCLSRLTGHPVHALGVSGYRHHVGASFGGGKTQHGRMVTTFRRRALSEQNKTFIMVMTYPAPVMQLILPFHLLLLVLEGVLLSILRGQLAYLTRIYLPVFRALIQNRGELLKARKAILGRRDIGPSGFFANFTIMPHKLRMLLRHGLPHLR